MTEAELQAWNALNPPGSPCILVLDTGEETRTATRSTAWRLGHGDVVVLLEGRSGGWLIERLKMLEAHQR